MAKQRGRKKDRVPETPTCNCLVLCDDVVISHAKGKHTLYGIIGNIAPPSLPHIIGPFVAYIQISNIYAQQRVTVSFETGDAGEPQWEFAAEFVSRSDPLQVHTLVARIPPFLIEKPGRYILRANHEGIPLAQTPITIHDRGAREQDHDHH